MRVIYKITNSVNGKSYIGSATNYSKRRSQHIMALRRDCHHNRHLQCAWNKYGELSFDFSILRQLKDNENLLVCEQIFVNKLNPSYNINKIVNSSQGVKRSPETREKIRIAVTGVKHPQWRCDLKSEAQGGNNHWTKTKSFSDIAKLNMSNAQKQLYSKGYQHPRKKPVIQLSKAGSFIKIWNSASDAAIELSLSACAISNCARCLVNSSGGYKWKYL